MCCVDGGRCFSALIAQLGERQTEDLKAPCSIHGADTFVVLRNS